MLQVENLSKSYSTELLFDDVSFTLQKGEKCALIGRNGSGKTTLFKILKKEEEPDSGRIILPKGYKLGFLEQHIQFTEETTLDEALKGPIQKAPHEVESILFGIGFQKEQLESHPSLLSGGYHLRLKLAKLLSEEPNCLLLDEPTNYLDIGGLRWLENYLKTWKGECILISHERSFLDPLVNYTMGLHRKKLKRYQGDTENFYEKILEEEQLHEKTRVKLDKKKAHLEKFIQKFGAKATKASQAQSKAKVLAKIPPLAQLAALEDLSFSFSYLPFHGKKMATLEEVSFSYEPEIPLLQNVSLEIEKGKKIAIIGKNGMGKSTLLQLIGNLLTPTSGTITRSAQAQIGYFGQTHIDRLSGEKTIEEEIASSNPDLTYTEVKGLCGHMMFSGDAAKKKISLLSGGERSRVLLGKILAGESNLLLLDEPTHHLDIESIEALLEAIAIFEGTVILVTHSEEMLKKMETDILIICAKEKQHVFLGTYEEFLEKKGWDQIDEKVVTPKKAKAPTLKCSEKTKIQTQISSLEKKIELAEQKHKELEALLLKACEKNILAEIQELSTKSEQLQNEISGLYEALDILYKSAEQSN
jgi:ATP-binding cassette subfamily F protein 3